MFFSYYTDAFNAVYSLVFPILPFVFFIIFAFIAWTLWNHYVRAKFINEKEWALLEIRLAREIFKSPKAMEVVLAVLNQSWEGTWYSRLTKGILRTWTSLELVSLGGKVHFYIRVDRFFKDLLEAQIYSQYPEVEIYEVAEDYSLLVPYDKEKEWKLFGFEGKLSKPDPYPIKTYVDYGLDSDNLKEEYKVDPLTATLEFLGSLGSDEQAWIQILVHNHTDRYKAKGKWFTKQDWKAEAKQEIDKIMASVSNKNKVGKDGTDFGIFKLTPGQTEIIKAIERSVSKVGFDCGLRIIYVAPRNAYRVDHQTAMRNLFRQFGTQNLNGFDLSKDTDVRFPWQDPTGHRVLRKKRIMLDAYRRRSWFYPPHARTPFILTTEELATIFHFPGGVVTTPTVEKIPSKKAEPPANLPV